jgi:hypothetical protein
VGGYRSSERLRRHGGSAATMTQLTVTQNSPPASAPATVPGAETIKMTFASRSRGRHTVGSSPRVDAVRRHVHTERLNTAGAFDPGHRPAGNLRCHVHRDFGLARAPVDVASIIGRSIIRR